MGLVIVLFVFITLFNLLYKQLLLDPGNFFSIVTDSMVLRSIWLTLYASFLATLIAVGIFYGPS